MGLFLGSIFDLFLDSALLVRDVFHGVLCDWTPVFGPFLDLFWDVHLSMILAFLGSCFHPPEVPVFEVLFFVGVLGGVQVSRVLVSGGWWV